MGESSGSAGRLLLAALISLVVQNCVARDVSDIAGAEMYTLLLMILNQTTVAKCRQAFDPKASILCISKT